MPTTEIATFRLVEGSSADNPQSDAAVKIKESVKTGLGESSVQSFFLGMQHERPDILETLITYDSIDERYAWMQQIGSVVSDRIHMFHVDLEPFDNFHLAMKSPITEIATFYFKGEPPADYLDAFYEFRKAAEEEEDFGLLASAAGVTHEEVDLEGIKGKAVVFIAGWRSREAHMAFKDTATYRLHMPKLVHLVEKVEACHVSFRHL